MTGKATLLMMPDGDAPEPADFAAGDHFASYEEAIRAAHERVAPSQPMVPWILVEGAILDPASVMAVNTPPRKLRTETPRTSLDEDLEATFPASDPPSQTQP